MAPPWLAELPKNVLALTVSVPLLLMPPPLPAGDPFSMVRLLMAAVPPLRVKTEFPEFPLTATRLVSAAPLPVVAPVMVVMVGIVSVPSVPSVIVFSAVVLPGAKTVGSKVMLPPFAVDASRASRSVQGPLPVPDGLAGQFDAFGVELSSWLVFTTNDGISSKSAVTVSAEFMVT